MSCVQLFFDNNCSTHIIMLCIYPLFLSYLLVTGPFTIMASPLLTGRTSTLDITNLETSVNIYYHQGLSLSTQRLYSTGQTRYYSFCQQLNCSSLTSTEQLLLLFVAHLANEGLAHATIKVYQLSVTSTSPQDTTKCLKIS